MDSKLQIISGMHRGRKLALPRGARPTQNRARIALFNMLMSIADTAPGVVWARSPAVVRLDWNVCRGFRIAAWY